MILFSDVEGTLFLRDDPEQTKRNLMAVDRWRGDGNLFIVATSYSIDTLQRLIPDDDLADCYIVNDGCAILLPQDEEIMQGSFSFIATSDLGDSLDLNEIKKLFADEDYKIQYFSIHKNSFNPIENPSKLRIWFKNEESASKYYPEIQKMDYRAICSKTKSNNEELRKYNSSIQILPKMSGKRWAAKTLIKKLGPNADKIFAVGDGESDIPMLEYFGENGYAINGSDANQSISQSVDSLETLITKLIN